jgi:hypothetical protein
VIVKSIKKLYDFEKGILVTFDKVTGSLERKYRDNSQIEFILCEINDTQYIYDLDGKEITTANFNVAIQYYVTQTVITISMTNENDSVSYLSNYTNMNGAVFSVVERSVA